MMMREEYYLDGAVCKANGARLPLNPDYGS